MKGNWENESDRRHIQDESAVKPLVDAAYSEKWKAALNILYISGGLLSFSEQILIPILIGFEGSNERNEEMIDLYQARMKTEASELLSPLFTRFLPKILTLMAQQDIEDTEEGTRRVVMVAIESMMNYSDRERMSEIIGNLLVKGISSFSSVFAAWIYKILFEKRQNIIENTLTQEKYESMLDGLRRMRFIKGILRVGMCGECGNFEIALTEVRRSDQKCPKCGYVWGVVTVYKFNENYEKLKANRNDDLPMFITSYLKHELALVSPFGAVEIIPFKVFNGSGSKEAEIDVYIPKESIGIECKTFEEWNFPLTDNRFGSMAGDLVKQLKNYDKTGVETVYIVTNLSADSIEKVYNKIEKENPKFKSIKDFEIIGRDLKDLFSVLDEIKEKINGRFELGFDKMIEGIQDKEYNENGK